MARKRLVAARRLGFDDVFGANAGRTSSSTTELGRYEIPLHRSIQDCGRLTLFLEIHGVFYAKVLGRDAMSESAECREFAQIGTGDLSGKTRRLCVR